jgi:spore coat polysaccharide biosynthesis protein SpsF (cytidylyltransferase family)
MTLDYPEDYEFFKRVFSCMGRDGKYFSLRKILVLLKEHPEIIEINKKMQSIYEQRYTEKYGAVNLNKA